MFRFLPPSEVLGLHLAPHRRGELAPFGGEVVEAILECHVGVPEDAVRELFVVGGVEGVADVLGDAEASSDQDSVGFLQVLSFRRLLGLGKLASVGPDGRVVHRRADG